MKKKIMLAIIAIAASLKVSAQIQFSEFKFSWLTYMILANFSLR